ncbi:MAG: CoA transferase [Undibacterium umbellatum]|uniref:CoA transferase n=1 Tax=Undibacterium umbellatum TaxID=2762300 RepID=UPI003BB6017F
MSAAALLASLWGMGGGKPDALQQLSFSGESAQLPSTFQVGDVASASIAVQALMAAQLWQDRDGAEQKITVDRRHALAMFKSDRYLSVNGKPADDPWSKIAGYYQAGDGRWIQLHTNFPHHRDGVLAILQCADERTEVAKAIVGWKAAELEQVLADADMCASMIRTEQEWKAHPQAQAIADLPLFEVRRIGDGPVVPLNQGGGRTPLRPLSGVRVLDLSRVIAAPVGARTLAQHGADVLAISAAHLPNIMPLVMDTGRGKRSAQLDLRDAGGRQQLHELIGGADVFLQAYRPGSLSRLGYSAEELCARHPGLIHVSLSAYGHVGPWANRRGFDSLVQSASGIADAEGQAVCSAAPGKLPFQALDHATGYLLAYATMLALQKRAIEGGSWQVRVSLAQTGRWLQAMPRRGLHEDAAELRAEEIAGFLQTSNSGFGQIQTIAPVEKMSLTPARFELPAPVLGQHAAVWM